MASAPSLLSRFQGCLVGAVVGDCIGAIYEELWADSIDLATIVNQVDRIRTAAQGIKEDGEIHVEKHFYTDDTAMTRSVAASLAHNNGLDEKDMAKRFTEEFLKEMSRGYGWGVRSVFSKLKNTEYKDPFGPAREQFDGQGSYGNGGAMRIAPAGLFSYQYNDTKKLKELAENITRITHSHTQAIQGAVLQVYAVDLALRVQGQLNVDKFIDDLVDRIRPLEEGTKISDSTESEMTERNSEGERSRPLEEGTEIGYSGESEMTERNSEGESVIRQSVSVLPYCNKLEKIRTFVRQESLPKSDEINEKLGTDISALNSVPAAVYSFLYSTKDIPQLQNRNPFEKAVMYAISLGGDTDTIATMAGAIAGACYGIEQIPQEWQTCCEGVIDAYQYAEDLYKLQKK